MLPATFDLAFTGHRSELLNKMDVSIRLLNMLLDREIITRQHFQRIEVSVSLFKLHLTLLDYATANLSMTLSLIYLRHGVNFTFICLRNRAA